MNAAARLALFAVAIALAFGGAFVAGSAIDPDPDPAAERGPSPATEPEAPAEHGRSPGGHP